MRSSRILSALSALAASLVCGGQLAAQPSPLSSSAVIDIGSRRELFVDSFLVQELKGGAELRQHHPVPQDVVMVFDQPWEGNATAYNAVFKDGDRYRMYYRAWNLTVTPQGVEPGDNPQFTCYAESTDGIHWRRPELGRHEFKGSKQNNIVFVQGKIGGVQTETGAPAVFRDENPNAQPEARYKTFVHYLKYGGGMLPLRSPDGLAWSLMSDGPAITDSHRNAFDAQNCAFWDAARGEYRAYWRYYEQSDGGRAIRTATSKDFIHWENRANLKYVDSPPEELYENYIAPYFRAPHLLIGFPVRYVERGWSDSMRALPELENRENRAKSSERYGTALTETLFMASRDGVLFKRWNEAFLRPGPERPGSWNYGHLYSGWQVLETKAAIAGAPNELSLYASEAYWSGRENSGHSSALRRYTLRLDGFVSAQAPMSGGELISKPLRFRGRQLALNFATSAAGSIRVEIQDAHGQPLPGFALDDCQPIFGDAIERAISWKQGSDVRALAGQTVHLRFVLNDADLFAFQFKD